MGKFKILISILLTLVAVAGGAVATIFLTKEEEPTIYTITYMESDLVTVHETVEMEEGKIIGGLLKYDTGNVDLVFDGWYTESTFENKFKVGVEIHQNYTIYPKIISKVSVTFKGVDLISDYKMVKILEGNVVTEPEVPTHESEYAIFKGWYVDNTLQNEFDFDTVITENITLFPKFDFKYDVVFKGIDLQTNYHSYTLNENGVTTEPEEPTHTSTYAIFKGWYTESTFENKFIFGGKVTQDLTLYPLFVYEYQLTFKNIDLLSNYKIETLDGDDVTVEPVTPTHSSEYAIFDGWYLDVLFTEKFVFGSTLSENLTLYPKFIFEYNVIFKGVDLETNYKIVKLDGDDILSQPTTPSHSSEFAVFMGWYTDKDLTNQFTGFGRFVTQDYTLYPKFQNEYKITYKNVNLTSDYKIVTYTDGEVTTGQVAPNHANQYAVFKGWYTENTFVNLFTFGTVINRHYTLYPLFVLEYNVVFYDIDLETIYKSEILESGDRVLEPETPSHPSEYVVFKGWYKEKEFANKFTFGNVVDAHYTLYPLFVYEYKLTYKGIDLESEYKVEVLDEDDITVRLAGPTHENRFAIFIGWFTDIEFENEFVFGTTIDRHYTLYPKYVFEYRYVLTFKASDLTTDYKVVTLDEDDLTVEPNVPPHVSQFVVFKGWFTENTFENQFTFGNVVTDDVTLYPKFVYEYKVTFRDIDLTSEYKVDILDEDDVTVEPITPTHESEYVKFKGWYTERTFTNKFTFGTTINRHYTLYPKFVYEYNIVFKSYDLETNYRLYTLDHDDILNAPDGPKHSSKYATFEGWYTEKEFINKFTFGSVVTTHYTFYPKYTFEYRLTFKDVDLESDYAVQILDHDDVTRQPDAPTHESEFAVFRGWYTENTFENQFTFGNIVDQDYTLYPKFDYEYEIVYKDVDLETDYKKVIILNNTIVTQPQTPTHESEYAVLNGWYLERTFENKFEFNQSINQDYVLYPKFDYEYEITYKNIDLVTNYRVEFIYNDSVTTQPETPVHESEYAVFRGWYTENTFINKFEFGSAITQDYTLYPLFEYEYEIVYKDVDLTTNYKVDILGESDVTTQPTTPTHESEYAVFRGWYTDTNFDTKFTFGTTITQDYTLYPLFEFEYEIVFKNIDLTTDYKVDILGATDVATQPTTPSHASEYAVFRGWYTENTFENKFIFGSVVTQDYTLYPLFEYEYEIVYMGYDLETVYTTQIIINEQTVTAPTAPTHPDEEAKFYGWYTDKAYENPFLLFGEAITRDYVLYPKYVFGSLLTVMDIDNVTIYSERRYRKTEPVMSAGLNNPTDSYGTTTKVIEGWYTDKFYETKFVFGSVIYVDTTLYPKVYDVSEGLEYREITSGSEVTAYSVMVGTCTDSFVVPCEYYYGKPVTDVRAGGFEDCTTIKEIYFTNTLTTINENAFKSSALEVIELPTSLTTLVNNPFNGCNKLVDLTVRSGNNLFASAGNAVIDRLTNTLVVGTKVTELSTSVTKIGNYAFANLTELTSITYTNYVTSIGEYAFYGTGLSEVVIPLKVTTVGAYAFALCGNVSVITLNATNMSDLVENNNVFYGTGVNGVTINIGKTATRVPAYMFYTNTNMDYNPDIRTLTFVDGGVCSTIGNYAFYNAVNLSTINYGVALMNNLSANNNIFTYAGCETTGLTVNITAAATNVPAYLFYPNSDLSKKPYITSLTFANDGGCRSIGNYAFYGATDLSVLNFGSTALDDFAADNNVFAYAGSNVTAGLNVNITSGATKVPSYMFYPSTNDSNAYPFIKTITFADGGNCKTIGLYAFYNCLNVTTINFGAKSMDDMPENNLAFYKVGRNGSGVTLNVTKSATKVPSYMFFPTSADASAYPFIKTVQFAADSACKSFGNYAFYSCLALETLEIPKNLTSLGRYTFYETRGLKIINYNATSITGERLESGRKKGFLLGIVTWDIYYKNAVFSYAGENTSGITLNVAANVTRIPNYLFMAFSTVANNNTWDAKATYYQSAKVNVINFASGGVLTTIGQGAFDYCRALNTVVIPSSVTTLDNNAFYNCTNLSTVMFAEGSKLNRINDYAFGKCSALSSMQIPNGVTYIGDHAYYDCTSLSTITMPSNLTTINSYAFYGCIALKTITIPQNVTSIGEDAFRDCENVTTINFNATNLNDLEEENDVFASVGDDTSGVTLNISKNVTKLPNYLFSTFMTSQAPNITNVVFETGSVCSSIGIAVFINNSSLTNITLPNSVKVIGNNAFDNCTKLASVDLGDSIETIGESAFDYCYNLTSLTLPDSLISIGNNAFNYCYKLTSLNIPSSVTSITGNPFPRCTSLNLTSSSPNYYIQGNCLIETSAKKLISGFNSSIIPSDVTVIGDYAFYYCTELLSVALPSTVTSIGEYAFAQCEALTNITIPSNVTSIGSYAFYYCDMLNTVTFETNSKCTSIGSYAFYECVKLTSIAIPQGVTAIEDYTFANCDVLRSITLPSSIGSIGSYAFYYCKVLSTITIPSNVTTIGDYAFYYCSALVTITLPSTVTEIGSSAFSNSGLTHIFCESEEVATLASGKGRADNYIYVLQASGGESLSYSETTVGSVTIYTATDAEGYVWVKTTDNKYYKAKAVVTA